MRVTEHVTVYLLPIQIQITLFFPEIVHNNYMSVYDEHINTLTRILRMTYVTTYTSLLNTLCYPAKKNTY